MNGESEVRDEENKKGEQEKRMGGRESDVVIYNIPNNNTEQRAIGKEERLYVEGERRRGRLLSEREV